MTTSNITISEAKRMARDLRTRAAQNGREISHSEALEQVAHKQGYRDWNTFQAMIGNRRFVRGESVRGRYLSQPFRATIIGARALGRGWFHLDLELEDAVDVVSFDSFSNLRKRVSGTVGPAGVSRERTSDGRPHLELDM